MMSMLSSFFHVNKAMDILPNKLKRKLKTPRTPRKTAKFDRLVTNLENEVNLPKDPVDLPMREDHELPMVDNNNEDNFIPILVHDEMDVPAAADPLWRINLLHCS
ncbi:hypothetical protein TNCT_452921 [Trichonephila clavata]|uniref:Uncharacterized protein n=1 Tax=Trichonephila clavata TaxID=2740835 RepID=A0A8X6LS89_TRICU|nr:hypothetical protein TNCT_452921 [Trichonephila clavata]